MRFPTMLLATCGLLATSAQAQVAEELSRKIQPNAIDRSIAQSPRPSSSLDNQAAADRLRAQQDARDAAARRALPSSSTTVDGPGGVQRLGSGVASPAPATAPPPPPPPQS
jgi:hypothetical protein